VQTNLVSSIKQAYSEGLSAEEIAEGYELELALVKTVLAGDHNYRLKEAAAGNLEAYEVVRADEMDIFVQAYKNVVLDSDKTPPSVRERGLRYLIDEGKGRNNNKSKTPPGVSFNIMMLQQAMVDIEAKKRKASEKVIESTTSPAPARSPISPGPAAQNPGALSPVAAPPVIA
jgi:hypothetical protein